MIDRFAAALQFLTVLPVSPKRKVALGEAAPLFPIVGALLGAIIGLIDRWLQPMLGPSGAALVAIISLSLFTGNLHEEGFADVADAVRKGRSKETMLQILKDSRIGSYGAIALIFVILIRWQGLSHCRINPIYGLAAALALSRSTLVLLAGSTPVLGPGLGAEFKRSMAAGSFFVSGVVACLLAVGFSHTAGVVMSVATMLVLVVMRAWFLRRLSGVNGDCLGAVCQVAETVNLLVMAWPGIV